MRDKIIAGLLNAFVRENAFNKDNTKSDIESDIRTFCNTSKKIQLIEKIMNGLHGTITFMEFMNDIITSNYLTALKDQQIKMISDYIYNQKFVFQCPELNSEVIEYFEYISELSKKQNFILSDLYRKKYNYDKNIVNKFVDKFCDYISNMTVIFTKDQEFCVIVSTIYTVLMQYYFSVDDDSYCIKLTKAIHNYVNGRSKILYNVLQKDTTDNDNLRLIKKYNLTREQIIRADVSWTYEYYILEMYKEYNQDLYKKCYFKHRIKNCEMIVKAIMRVRYNTNEQLCKLHKKFAVLVDSFEMRVKNFSFNIYVEFAKHATADTNINILEYFEQHFQIFDYCLNEIVARSENDYCCVYNIDSISSIAQRDGNNVNKAYNLLVKWMHKHNLNCCINLISKIINIYDIYNKEKNKKNDFINRLSSIEDTKIKNALTEVLLMN